jgi:MFS family permease
LYLSAFSSVIGAIVGDFPTLIISRAFIGICVGLNVSVGNVLIAERVVDKDSLDTIVMASGIVFTMGGVLSAVLGYFLLQMISWRFFILITSLPVFIPTIFILHLCLSDEEEPQEGEEANQRKESDIMTVPNFAARTIKLGLLFSVSIFQGWLTILLAPELIQLLNSSDVELESNCYLTAVHGVEILLLGLVTLAALPGKLLMHFIRNKISFRKSQVAVALLNIGAFSWMLAERTKGFVTIVATNCIVKFLYGISHQALLYVWLEVEYFGTARFALGNSITYAMGTAGGMVGTVMISFAPAWTVITTAVVLSVFEIMIVLSMKEAEL